MILKAYQMEDIHVCKEKSESVYTKKMDKTFHNKMQNKGVQHRHCRQGGCLPTLGGGGEDMGWWYMYMYEFKQPYFTLHWQFKRFTILFWAPFSPHFFSKKVKNYYLPPPSYFVTKTTVQIPLIKWSTTRHILYRGKPPADTLQGLCSLTLCNCIIHKCLTLEEELALVLKP